MDQSRDINETVLTANNSVSNENRRISTGSDKSFKTTDETSVNIEEHLKSKSQAVDEPLVPAAADVNTKTVTELASIKQEKKDESNSDEDDKLVIDDERPSSGSNKTSAESTGLDQRDDLTVDQF